MSGALRDAGSSWSWRVTVSIRRFYGRRRREPRQPPRDRVVAGLPVVAALVAAGHVWLGFAVAMFVAALADRRAAWVVLVLAVATVGTWRGVHERAALAEGVVGPYDGWVHLVDDPQPFGSASRVVVEIEGQRYEMWRRGRAARIRAATWRGGEWLYVSGERGRLDPERQKRVAWQHVVGAFDAAWVSDVVPGGPIDRASNRVRVLIERGASHLPAHDGALFRGLVIGDDRDQPPEMIGRFRASGLSHLTAVSGQNVSFVLAAAGPLLVRLRAGWRWAVTLGLIAWFVSLTRFEPSIVRAGAMAALSATGFALGRERSPFRLLCWAVVGLLLVDPLLVGSVGFWLSVGATGGVTTIGPWLGERLGGLGVVGMPVGVTLGAQAGVVVPALLVFGRLPLVSIPANLLAVPVAGFVMLYGLPAGLVAGIVPQVATVVMLPCRIGVRWVDTVAALGERVEPGGRASWVGWAAFVVAIGAIAAMNRDRHGSPPADRRRRVDPAVEGARPDSPVGG